MHYDDVLARIQAAADPRAVAVWQRMGVSPEQYLGANLTKLKAIAKQIKRDHDLALRLWDSKIHDAKLLATMIEEPKKASEQQIDRQVQEIYSIDLADTFCNNVVAKTPWVSAKVAAWTTASSEMIKRCGYMLVVAQAKHDPHLPDSYFLPFLATIAQTVHDEPNWVREAMNYVLIGVGLRNPALNSAALAVAQQVGRIMIDYGDTSCQAPDPLIKLQAPKRLPAVD